MADDVLARIAQLYAIKAGLWGQSPAERKAVRQAQSRSLVDSLHALLEARLTQASRKSVLAEAIRYALTRFLDDGRVELDSNTVERAIRPLALNRKNALFAGPDEGGQHWAVIASLIETAKLNSVDPQVWLASTLAPLQQAILQRPWIASCRGTMRRAWPENTAYGVSVGRPPASST